MDDPKKEDRAPGGDAVNADNKEANWSHDIENREYYYDDATGYEVYDPDKEGAEEEEDTGEGEARKD